MNGNVRFVFGDVEPETLRRVLLIRLDNLGDVLLTTPAFRAVPQGPPTRLLRPAGLPRLPLLRAGHLGHGLRTAPAFRAVRQALPNAHLALLAGPAGCEI